MHFSCTCGARISDTRDQSPTRGYVIADEDLVSAQESLAADVREFLASRAAGRQDDWLRAIFGAEYPRDQPPEEVILDLVDRHLRRPARSIYECEACGALHLDDDRNGVASYGSRIGYAGALRSRRTRR